MLPMPATSRWSKSIALIGAVRPTRRPARTRVRREVIEGIAAEGFIGERSHSSGVNTATKPKVRGSTNRSSTPESVHATKLVWGSAGRPGNGQLHSTRHPEVHDPAEVAFDVGHDELADRPTVPTPRPVSRSETSVGRSLRRAIRSRRTSTWVEPAAFERGCDRPAGRFDFGEFGH
jgi:hypothetical protein